MGMRSWISVVFVSSLVGAYVLFLLSAVSGEDDLLVEDEIDEVTPSVPTSTVSKTDSWCREGIIGRLLNTNYILVSTMDGKVTALDVNSHGRIAWTADTDSSPLLSGTLNSLQLTADGHPYMLVPSLDGSLYMFNMDSNALNPIPVNTDISVMIGEDAVAGGTIVSTTGVDPITGQIRYHCTTENCAQMTASNRTPYTLIIRRNTQVARAADPLNAQVRAFLLLFRWNLSVAEYSISLASSDRSLNNYFFEPNPSMTRFRLRPPDGVVSAFNGGGDPMWERDLNSPIARVWQLINGRVHEASDIISLFDSNNVETPEGQNYEDQRDMPKIEAPFYFGTVNSEPYIIPSANAREDLRRFALTKENARFQPYGADLTHYGRALYLHDITITNLIRRAYDASGAIKPGAVTNYRGYRSCPMSDAPLLAESTDLQRVGFGNEQRRGDLGWFVFKSISRRQRNSAMPTNGRYERNVGNNNNGRRRTNLIERVRKKLNADEPVSGWWRIGALALSVMLIPMCTIVLIYILHFRHRLGHLQNNSDAVTSEESTLAKSSLKRSASSIATSSTVCSSPNEPLALRRKSSSTHRTTSTTASQAVPDPFSSKFLEDFIPEKLLGKGGYGVVFNCRHRLDDCSYAVKRIAVSDTASAIERVKREARAMAKLDHPGIIRYYHTWMERPPEGWQQTKDKEILKNIRALSDSFNSSSATRSSDGVFHLRSKESLATISTQGVMNENRCGTVGEWSSLNNKLIGNGIMKMQNWEARGDVPLVPSETVSDSWADDDGNQNANSSEGTACSSSDSDSSDNNDALSICQNRGVNTESSDVVFENETCSKEDQAVGHSRKSLSSNSSGALEPPAVLVASETDLHTCKKTKDFVYFYIQMELCQELTLHNWLLLNNRQEDRQLERIRNWLAQLVCAIDYIHDQGLIHRDLKPQNIFFSADVMNILKIGDLGLATNYVTAETGEEARENEGIGYNRHTGNVGTRLYMSPEQLKGCTYDEKIDVFSLGLIFTEMLIPFQTIMERNLTLSKLQSGILPNIYLRKRTSELEFISWLTKLDPKARPSCHDIMQCEYLEEELNSLGMPFTRSCVSLVSLANKKRS
ncbi:unnamed protein product [Anisakis simplex]|uniref:PRKR-like endoplasmic reticulum kinase n=1 Tax=Anisakis simplex TaxID=6269 RepID=A0A158PNV4_ANISI|nr:unnamed protein product [Anisakis simplex]